MSKYGRRAAGTPLTDEERAQLKALAKMPDSEIDFSDIPERVYGSARGAELPLETHTVTLRVDAEVAEWLDRVGDEAAQEINLVLRRTARRRRMAATSGTTAVMFEKAS